MKLTVITCFGSVQHFSDPHIYATAFGLYCEGLAREEGSLFGGEYLCTRLDTAREWGFG